MNGIQITRAELMECAMMRLFNDSSIQQIIKDAAKEFYAENALVSVSYAAEMLDVDDQTFRALYRDKIKRLGPRLSRVKVAELKQLIEAA